MSLKLKPTESSFEKINTFCSLPFNKLILNSWGEVSMCCHQLVQLGKLDEQTEILDLWHGPTARAIREETANGNLHPVCTSWNSCPFIVKDKVPYDYSRYKGSLYPTHIEICLPDKHCNVGGENPSADNPACIMCRRNFEITDQQDITDFLCKKVKKLMPYLTHLSVLGIAEPFWKDATFRIMDNLDWDTEKDHIQFTTNTNGICLTERVAQKFFDRVPSSDLSWSLDSATPETHVKIRRLDAFDLVVRNLKRWIEMRKLYGDKKKHKVCIYNNINLLNVHEMTQMVELAVEIGVDKMIMLPTYDQAGVVKLGELVLCEKNVHIFKEASEKAMNRAKELNFSLHYSKRFDILPPTVQQLVQVKFQPPKTKFEAELVQIKIPSK